jgi:hypothetical protein
MQTTRMMVLVSGSGDAPSGCFSPREGFDSPPSAPLFIQCEEDVARCAQKVVDRSRRSEQTFCQRGSRLSRIENTVVVTESLITELRTALLRASKQPNKRGTKL